MAQSRRELAHCRCPLFAPHMSAFGPKRTPAIALKNPLSGVLRTCRFARHMSAFSASQFTIHAFAVERLRLGMRDGAGFLWTIWAIKAFEPSFREHPIIDPICVVPILLLSYLSYSSQSPLPVRSKRHDQKNTTLSYWQLQNRPKCARNGRHETATENNR